MTQMLISRRLHRGVWELSHADLHSLSTAGFVLPTSQSQMPGSPVGPLRDLGTGSLLADNGLPCHGNWHPVWKMIFGLQR